MTNLLIRVGDYVVSGSTKTSIVDTEPFWIDDYFEGMEMSDIQVGDGSEICFMGYSQPIQGTVESITLDISTADATASMQGLPHVSPVYTWVRLAQRVPVCVQIDKSRRAVGWLWD